MQEDNTYSPENDAQIAEAGMPKGAALETQLQAAEALAEAPAKSAEARLQLKLAEQQVEGLNTREAVGDLAKRGLKLIEGMVDRRSKKLAEKADKARKAKEKHEGVAGGIRDKWVQKEKTILKTEVVANLAAGIDSDIKVGRKKSRIEGVLRLIDDLKTLYRESRAVVNAKKETQRGKAAGHYKEMASTINKLSLQIETTLSTMSKQEESDAQGAVSQASENEGTAQARENVAVNRFDTSMGVVDAAGEVGRASVYNKDVNDVDGQRDAVDQAKETMVESMNNN